ncbi:hypothetical protein FXO38_00991 [Capsicum annuum]|nr:hypothetical protein FXO38_00991 [Capsicum annuum]
MFTYEPLSEYPGSATGYRSQIKRSLSSSQLFADINLFLLIGAVISSSLVVNGLGSVLTKPLNTGLSGYVWVTGLNQKSESGDTKRQKKTTLHPCFIDLLISSLLDLRRVLILFVIHFAPPFRWDALEESFPQLETLVIKGCYMLEEIPLSFADIPTLRQIKLINCNNKSLEASAVKIKEEVADIEGCDRIDLTVGVLFEFDNCLDNSSESTGRVDGFLSKRIVVAKLMSIVQLAKTLVLVAKFVLIDQLGHMPSFSVRYR